MPATSCQRYLVDPDRKKGSWLIPWAVHFLLLVVLGTVRILGSWGTVPGSDTSGDGPHYLVKNTEGGAKYQVVSKKSHFLSEVAKLCENKLTSLREHKPSRVGPWLHLMLFELSFSSIWSHRMRSWARNKDSKVDLRILPTVNWLSRQPINQTI